MSQSFTRKISLPTVPRGTIDPRYLKNATWHVMYEQDGELVFAIITCRPDQSVKNILASRNVDIMDAIVEEIR